METKEEDKDKKLEEIIVLLCEKGDLSSQTDQIIKDSQRNLSRRIQA
ncbi:hypothetical protein HpHCM45_05720 [Helicobacter pylori]